MQICPDFEVNQMRPYWENATSGLQLVQHYIFVLDNQLNTDDYINSASFSSCWSETQLSVLWRCVFVCIYVCVCVCVCVEGGSEQCCAGDPLNMVDVQFYIASDVQ